MMHHAYKDNAHNSCFYHIVTNIKLVGKLHGMTSHAFVRQQFYTKFMQTKSRERERERVRVATF
jgi:hypothetical protein